MSRRWHGLLVKLLALVLVPLVAPARTAWAWDPATTQAGLTERALLASSFHKLLADRLGRPLGALEPLALHSQLLPGDLRQTLWARLAMLDPAGGYRPDADGVNSALAWVTAGAVLAETPPERGRHNFFEPGSGKGLDDADGVAGTLHALRLSVDAGGSLRDLATGASFDMTGLPSLRWLRAPENDLGLPVWESELARAVSAREPVQREAALTRALLALGGSLALLEDAGEPAHVRNDFRGAFLDRQGPSGWDRGSRFERFVVDHYGRSGIPPAAKPVSRPSLESFFTDKDGQGLADRTQRRFFSDGTTPEEIPIDAVMTPKDVADAARASLRFALPNIPRLELRGPAKRRYVMNEGRRALAYIREPEGVRFFLDASVFADSAAALLPEVVSYAAGFIDHLLRGTAAFTAEAGNVTVKLEGFRGDKAEGTLEWFVEDQTGRRQSLNGAGNDAGPSRALAPGETIAVQVPTGTRRVAVCFRGKDAAGPLLIVGEAAVK
jgi:hypothetical protein